MGHRYFAIAFVLFCLLPFAFGSLSAHAQDQAPAEDAVECSRDDFEAVVDETGAALRKLNQANTPKFQAQLRKLKDKNGWSHDEFLKKAAPFVRDQKIAVFDEKSTGLLTEISTLGEEGAENAKPDCALLIELRARMTVLVKTQQGKWTYMFDKISKALESPPANTAN